MPTLTSTVARTSNVWRLLIMDRHIQHGAIMTVDARFLPCVLGAFSLWTHSTGDLRRFKRGQGKGPRGQGGVVTISTVLPVDVDLHSYRSTSHVLLFRRISSSTVPVLTSHTITGTTPPSFLMVMFQFIHRNQIIASFAPHITSWTLVPSMALQATKFNL